MGETAARQIKTLYQSYLPGSSLDTTTITEYEEQLVRQLIEKVTVYEDKFTVEFKSGVTMDVET